MIRLDAQASLVDILTAPIGVTVSVRSETSLTVRNEVSGQYDVGQKRPT